MIKNTKWNPALDPTLLQVVIAKKLAEEVEQNKERERNEKGVERKKQLKLQNNTWPVDWSEETVKTDNEGNKLQKMGNLFWREEQQPDKTWLSKQLDVKDLEGRIDQIASGQWAHILDLNLKQANPADTAFLDQIDPDTLHTTNQKELSI